MQPARLLSEREGRILAGGYVSVSMCKVWQKVRIIARVCKWKINAWLEVGYSIPLLFNFIFKYFGRSVESEWANGRQGGVALLHSRVIVVYNLNTLPYYYYCHLFVGFKALDDERTANIWTMTMRYRYIISCMYCTLPRPFAGAGDEKRRESTNKVSKKLQSEEHAWIPNVEGEEKRGRSEEGGGKNNKEYFEYTQLPSQSIQVSQAKARVVELRV